MVYGELGEIPPSIEIKCRILKYWASMLTNPDKLSSRLYIVLFLLYNNNDYKSPWLKYVENTLNVNGLGFYWLTQAVDNIDSLCILLKHDLQINSSKNGILILIHLENVVVIVYLKQILH